MIKGPNLSSLTYLLFQIAAAIDDGKAKEISFEEVYSEIEAGTIFPYLQQQFGQSADMSLLTTTRWDQGRFAVEALQGAASALKGRERRKTGIEKSGIALLIAITTEAIQECFSEELKNT